MEQFKYQRSDRDELLEEMGVTPEDAKQHLEGVPLERWDYYLSPKSGMLESAAYVVIARGDEKRLMGEVSEQILEDWMPYHDEVWGRI